MTWHPHLDVWALVVTAAGGYLLAVRHRRRRVDGTGVDTASRSQVTCFLLGVAAIWIAADWPVHELSENYLYSVHMVQHMLLSLVAPPLLLMGTPAWMARAVLRPTPLLRVARRLTRPVPALVLFNAVIALSHWTAVVNLTARVEAAHFLVHAALFGTSMLMWMPVLSPVIELPRLPYPGQMIYLFAQSLLPTIPASFLTFGTSPLYRHYAEAPRLFEISAITDQRIAGLFMKIVGGFVLWAVIAVLFFRWHAQESTDGSDALQWRDVERDLNRAGLTR